MKKLKILKNSKIYWHCKYCKCFTQVKYMIKEIIWCPLFKSCNKSYVLFCLSYLMQTMKLFSTIDNSEFGFWLLLFEYNMYHFLIMTFYHEMFFFLVPANHTANFFRFSPLSRKIFGKKILQFFFFFFQFQCYAHTLNVFVSIMFFSANIENLYRYTKSYIM